jgi:hypothetical protein
LNIQTSQFAQSKAPRPGPGGAQVIKLSAPRPNTNPHC